MTTKFNQWQQFAQSAQYTFLSLKLGDKMDFVDQACYEEFMEDNPECSDQDFVEYMIEDGVDLMIEDQKWISSNTHLWDTD